VCYHSTSRSVVYQCFFGCDNFVLGARDLFWFQKKLYRGQISPYMLEGDMAKSRKKSKYRSVLINKKRYYYYKITWIDPTGDSGHATAQESLSLVPSTMITHAYVFHKNKKSLWTFASYEENDELFSDRNVFPLGCITKMEKITL